ncbi:MAG: DUF4034 domain-containing protein [Armatimonadota bacterium]|nr:MAG: DUF4034 domain-containing protein [Armatimonadota bacterium]
MSTLIPTDPNAITQNDLDRMSLAINLRTMPEAYQSVGEHSATWDEPAVAFLESVARRAAKPTSIDLAELVSRGAALHDLGCADPMFLYAYGGVMKKVGRIQDAEVLLRRSLDGLLARGYPRIRAAMAAGNLALIYRSLGGGDDPEAEKYFRLHLQYLNESLADGSFAPGEERLLLDTVTDWWYGLYEGKEREVYEALKSNPKADPYTTKVVGGMYHIAAAWQERGDGWASEVTEEGWKGFETHLGAARRLLTEAWHLNPKLPYAAAEMITVEGAAGEYGADRLWFRRSVTAQLDYINAYTNFFWFLRPRWGGSHEDMYEFALHCLSTKRFDTDVPLMFAWGLRDMTDDLDGDPEYWRTEGVYELLEGMFAGYAEAQPEKSEWFESVHAAAAYQCGKHERAKDILDKLGGNLDESAFQFYALVPSATARQKVSAQPVVPVSGTTAAGPRNVLHAFNVFTPAEDPYVFLDEGTWSMPIGDMTGRVADARQRIVYSFTIPPDVEGAVLYTRIVNNFAIAVARDEGGKPAEFHEELNAIKWLGRLSFDGGNEHEQVVDLTSYLADNPSRKVYVAIYSAYPQGGWGAAFPRIEVVALDDEEQQRVDRVRRGAAYFAQQDRARYVLYFIADGGPAERQYIYQDTGSSAEAGYRELGGDASVTYRLPVSAKLLGYSVEVWAQGDYVVSIAADWQGKPGEFEEIKAARDRYPDDVLEAFGNMDNVIGDLFPEILDSGSCYLKVADANPDNAARVIIRDVCL